MNLADVIAEHAAARPAAPAVITPGRNYSYGELDCAVWRAAAWLRERGAGPGDVVGVSLERELAHLIVILALARMGAVQLPLARHESQSYRDALVARFRPVLIVDAAPDGEEWLASGPVSGSGSLHHPGGDAPWKLVFTSGTTGKPKAVLQTHAMHLAWRGICQAGIPATQEDRFFGGVGLEFHAGFLRLANVFHAGGAVLLGFPPQYPVRLIELFERLSVTNIAMTPPHLSWLLGASGDQRQRLRSVRVLRTGSMNVSGPLRRELLQRLTPNVTISYGTNDAGTPMTVARGESLLRIPGSVGAAAPGVEIGIAGDDDAPLETGMIGHVRVRAPGIPERYLDDPESSARTYRGGWYYPGDLGQLSPEGELVLKGRVDERMTFDGIKIYPSEVEDVLLQHSAVGEAAVFPLDSLVRQQVPAAAVVLNAPVAQQELLAWARERLGVRAPQVIMQVDALPRNARGKVLKSELARSMAAAVRKPGHA